MGNHLGECLENVRTSATSAESSVAVAPGLPNANHLSIDIFRLVGFDVGRTTAAVGNFSGFRHFESAKVGDVKKRVVWSCGGMIVFKVGGVLVCDWQKLESLAWEEKGGPYNAAQPQITPGMLKCLVLRIRRQRWRMSRPFLQLL